MQLKLDRQDIHLLKEIAELGDVSPKMFDQDHLCLSQIQQSAQPNGKKEKCHQALPPSATVNLTKDKSCREPRVVPSHGKAADSAPLRHHRDAGRREHFQQIPKSSSLPSRGSTFVPMMQTAHLRHCYHTPRLRQLHRTTLRRVLLQRHP